MDLNQQQPVNHHHDDDIMERRLYKAAITLNNIGVVLLSHSSYDDAVSAFKSSYDIVKSIAARTQQQTICIENNDSQQLLPTTIESKSNNELQIAYQNLLRSTQSFSNNNRNLLSSSSEEERNKYEYFDLTILSENDTNNEKLFEAAHSYPTDNAGYAIRLDAVSESSDSFFLETSIIMFNYSTALRCVVVTTTCCCDNSQNNSNSSLLIKQYIQYSYELLKRSLKLLVIATKNQDSVINLVTEQQQDDDITTTTTTVISKRSHDDDVMIHTDYNILECAELVAILIVQGLLLMSIKNDCYNEQATYYYILLGDLHLGHKKRNNNNGQEQYYQILDFTLLCIAPAA